MYTEYFGLREAPFNATPDPRFLYRNRAYDEAYATLLYGVRERQGFIVLTGEVGTGKTTLLRRLMDELAETTRFIFLYNTMLTAEELVDVICAELDLPVAGLRRIEKIHVLNEFLLTEAERGGSVVLLLDEAQNLSPDALEHLRLISNLETTTAKLLQIVLVGQPELQVRLDDPRLRQVRQRIAVRYHLTPLPPEEVDAFIRHRLGVAGRHATLFASDAVRRIAAYTGGIPRLVNILCNAVLLHAYAVDAATVGRRLVDEAADDLLLRRGRRRPARRPRAVWVATGVAGLVVAAAAVPALVPGALADHVEGAGQWLSALLRGGRASRPAAPAAPAASASSVEIRSVSVSPGEEAPGRLSDAPSPAASPPPELDRASMAPAGVAGANGWPTVVRAGASISEIVFDRYGHDGLLVLDLVKEFNPHIGDLDHVAAGERVWLPALTLATLARRQRDGSFRLTIATLPSADAADRFAESVRDTGYDARVTPRYLTAAQRAYRVEIEHLAGREAVRRAWRTALRLGWMPASRVQGE